MLFSRSRPFIIAEMANSHEGDLKKAMKIVDAASFAKADAIKFQKFFANEEAEPGQKFYDVLKKLEMKNLEWKNLISYAKRKKLKVFVDVDGIKSLKSILKFNVDGYKIHTSDQTNPELIKFLGKLKIPILLSSAGSNLNELSEVLKILSQIKKEIVIMHGYQGYPTKINDLNLSRIKTLRKHFSHFVGISDHVSADSQFVFYPPVIAHTLGASIIEKHITLDRSLHGTDYYSALNPDEFKNFVSLIKSTKNSLGNRTFNLSYDEKLYRLKHKKNTISKKYIKKDTPLSDKLFDFKVTKIKTDSIQFYEYDKRTNSIDIPSKTIIKQKHLNPNEKKVSAVIACRIDSNRLFAKPMQLINKRPILELLITQIKKSELISDIVLAISENSGNEIFIDFAKKHGLKFIVGSDRDVLHRLILGGRLVNADIIFRVTSENPYIYWEGIDYTIKNHISKKLDYSTVLPLPLGSSFELINLKSLEISHENGTKRHRSEHCDLYIFENKKKFKIDILEAPKNLQYPTLRLTVDTPEDLVVARKIYDYLKNKNEPIPLSKIINFLNENEFIRKLNFNKEMHKGWLKLIADLTK
jgi:N,N'-diacetyllegionaminate synthase